MNNLQRVINLIAIIGVFLCLLYLNIKVNQKDERVGSYNQITRALARGEQLSESQLQMIAGILRAEMADDKQNTSFCLIKAYAAIYGQVDAKALFSLFQNSQHEYDNVDNCLNYYTILLYRARNMQKSERQKVVKIVEQLQKQEIDRKYPFSKYSQDICVYFSTFNSEKTIKDQIGALNAQDFRNYSVEINDRGSTDNTYIIASYTLKEMFGDKEPKIVLKTNTDEGIFTALKRFTTECADNSIILVIADNETLIGSNVLETVRSIFASQQLDIAVFSALQTTHLNLEYPTEKDLLNVKAPILAYRKAIFQRYDKLLKFEEETTLQPFWRTWLANHLLSLRNTSNLKLKTINQALVFRQPSKNQTEPTEFQALSSRYNAIV